MRNIHYYIIFIFINSSISCSNNIEKTKTKEKPSFEKLLVLYKDITFDTLAVYSSTEDLESQNYKYKGGKIDTSLISLYPKEIQEMVNYSQDFFACYKFNIDNNLVGLITRIPSEYVSSSIRLMVFDKKNKKITNEFELAESWGDAGDAMTKDSWIYKNKEKDLEWFYWRQDCSYDTDTSSTTSCQDSVEVFKLKKGKVIGLHLDTLSLNQLKNRIIKK